MKKNVDIRLATLFSGIGAIEQAFLKMHLPHSIVFACDNGEIEFTPLDVEERREFAELKRGKSLSDDQQCRLADLQRKIDRRLAVIKENVSTLLDKDSKRAYVERLYKYYSPGKENLVKLSYCSNYAIRPSDFHLDVRFLDGRDYEEQVDLMVGGSPCQSFSSNGKRGGMDDTRGTLFYDYARIINEVKPKCFIFENVKGMLVHDNGETWAVIKSVFEDLDYRIYLNKDKNGYEKPILNAVDFGIPQNRERIYLIGIRKDIKLKSEFKFPGAVRLRSVVNDFLDENVPAEYYLGRKGFEFVTTHPSRAQVGSPIMNCQKANQQFNWNGDFIFEPLSNKHTTEILARAYVGVWNGSRGVCRKFTPRECLRLMGFPDTFKIVVNDQTMYRQAGNSIVVNVLEKLLEEIIKTGVFES